MAIGLAVLIRAGVTVSLQNLVSPPFVGASWDDARRDDMWSIITSQSGAEPAFMRVLYGQASGVAPSVAPFGSVPEQHTPTEARGAWFPPLC